MENNEWINGWINGWLNHYEWFAAIYFYIGRLEIGAPIEAFGNVIV